MVLSMGKSTQIKKHKEIDKALKDIHLFAVAFRKVGEDEDGLPISRRDIQLVGELFTNTVSDAEKQLKELIK